MSEATWTRLAAPFEADAVTWDVAAIDEDEETALMAPRLTRHALVARLDAVVGVAGWSLDLRPGAAGSVLCTLEVAGVRKSAAVDARRGGAAVTADAALSDAAGLFGMRPAASVAAQRVAYDVVADVVLEDPAATSTPASGVEASVDAASLDADAGLSEPAQDLTLADARERGLTSEGLRMIDRLVERLKDEGHGLQAARLLVRYGGYGKDADAARELYGALRALLKRAGEGRSVS